jgi:hypothetical protein
MAVSAVIARLDPLWAGFRVIGAVGFTLGSVAAALLAARRRLAQMPEEERTEVRRALREEYYGVRFDALRRRRGVVFWSIVSLFLINMAIVVFVLVFLARAD